MRGCQGFARAGKTTTERRQSESAYQGGGDVQYTRRESGRGML
jgi:hypothetical protein